MKKITPRKNLTLSKETLRTLDPGALEAVQGGTTFIPGIVIGITISILLCDTLAD